MDCLLFSFIIQEIGSDLCPLILSGKMDDLDIEIHSSSDTEEEVQQTVVVYEDVEMMLIGK